MAEWIRFIAGSIFLLIGLFIFCVQLFGVFRYKYVLNRMHAAAMGEFALVILFLWCASPVSSHLIARLEVTTNEKLEEYCKTEKETDK